MLLILAIFLGLVFHSWLVFFGVIIIGWIFFSNPSHHHNRY